YTGENVVMNTVVRELDPRSLVFAPLGLGGPMAPGRALALAAHERERMALPAVVPESVRAQFGSVLKQYADGIFTYENYTSVCREADRVLEVALKVRFLEHYADGVPLRVDGTDAI